MTKWKSMAASKQASCGHTVRDALEMFVADVEAAHGLGAPDLQEEWLDLHVTYDVAKRVLAASQETGGASIPAARPVVVVVEIREGVVSEVTANADVRVVSIDHDTEGCDPGTLHDVPVCGEVRTQKAWFQEHAVIGGGNAAVGAWIGRLVAIAEADAA